MDIKISNNWLKEYFVTKSSPKEIGDKLALCGPSVEKITKVGSDYIYDIEVTTNRVDCMSVMGIAREASAIINNSKLKIYNYEKPRSGKQNLLKIKTDKKLVNRVMAVVMEVTMMPTPKVMQERLESAGMRSLNSIVDITNYVMQEIGHPTHVFDFDLVKDGVLNFRLSKKGEKITTFDGKEYTLPGDDVVIDDGQGNIIDLPGIIGLKNSVVNKDTKRIIFFVDNIDKDKIRKTSTRLGIRTNAAILNEKGVDPELAELAFTKGVELYHKICKAKIISRFYDIKNNKSRTNKIEISHEFIEKMIGISIDSKKVVEILEKLGFEVSYNKRISANKKLVYLIDVPSWRQSDVTIQEDIVEEVARIYGYFNLPSEIMTGHIPASVDQSFFKFENKIKQILKSHGGLEIYTNSLVSKEMAGNNALQLKNPLGGDTEYMRTNLLPSLVNAVKENRGEENAYYLFEVANIYNPRKNDLPQEKMQLGIIFANYDFRRAKGIVESLFEELNIKEDPHTLKEIGGYWYFEIDIETLKNSAKDFKTFEPVSKYPSQIEDITLSFPNGVRVGEVLRVFEKAELVDNFKDYYTFRVWFHSDEKTLNDRDVEKIRERYLKEIAQKFGGVVKG